ncbi:hypothetical protein SynBOUM118_02326 [Synechococcus sp. BOUM118]|nr:hypothetical protein SynBOUM118_02326 [Synechococcus sp. BOUM118]
MGLLLQSSHTTLTTPTHQSRCLNSRLNHWSSTTSRQHHNSRGVVGCLHEWDWVESWVELLVGMQWEAGSPTRRSWEPQSVLLLVPCWGGQLADDSSPCPRLCLLLGQPDL